MAVVLKAHWFSKKARPAESRMMSKAVALNSGSAKRLSKKATMNNRVRHAQLISQPLQQAMEHGLYFQSFFQLQQKMFHFQGICCTCVVLPWLQKLTGCVSLQTVNALNCKNVQMKQCTDKGLHNFLLPFFILKSSQATGNVFVAWQLLCKFKIHGVKCLFKKPNQQSSN